MSERPAELDGAKLLHFAVAAAGSSFGVVHDADTDKDIAISALAICRYTDSPKDIYLFACDAEWIVRGDLVYETIETAKSDAERYYETGPLTWQHGEPTTT